MKGFGTDEAPIIEIFGSRTNEQLRAVSLQFKTMYGKDLEKDLRSEISGNFRKVVCGRLKAPADYDAWCLFKAMDGAGTNEACLIEILSTRTNAEIKAIKQAYRMKRGKNLEDAVMSETSGHFKRLLVSLLQANRDENPNVDMALAKKDAEDLYAAGEGKWGTDESTFNKILVSRSPRHLNGTQAHTWTILG